MIERLRAAWAALCGAPVLATEGWIAVAADPRDGKLLGLRWNGLVAEDAAKALYQAGDAIVEKLPPLPPIQTKTIH